jgi:archaemetzincin
MKPDHITLISFGSFEKRLLPEIVDDIARETGVPVFYKEGFIDVGDFFNPERKQYDGNKLLMEVETRFASDNEKIIALFNVDLFIPILTFIYGQAFLNGRCGIVSGYRLRNEKYGLTADDKVFSERLIKEIIHELGHTFGLKHCLNPVCVMRSSTYVEDIDQKGGAFCSACKSIIS